MRRAAVGAVVVLVGMAALVISGEARAAVPEVISFQARLSDSAGKAVADEAHNVTFRIYDSEAAAVGGEIWADTVSVTTKDGLFSVLLGHDTQALGLAFDTQYWLGIEVEADSEMTPRFQLAAAPYALRAASAASADTADALGSVTEGDVTTLQSDVAANSTDILANATDLAGKADAAALNDGDDATTPVGWNDLANVPAGFADNVDDDTQLTGAEVASYVTTSPVDLAAGTTIGGVALSPDGHAHSSLSGPGGSPADALVVDGAGDITTSGTVVLGAAPTADLHATTKKYVDEKRLITSVSGRSGYFGDSGLVTGRVLDFTKVHANSRLRITYCDNLRIWTDDQGAEWEVLIDGASIADPFKLSTALWTIPLANHHRQSTLIGYADNIPAGPHQLTVSINPIAGAPDCDTGWMSTFLLEVEEILP